MGRLIEAHTGSEARGALVGQGGAQDGPYSHSYRYDPQGNMWYRVGWGGSFNPWLEQWPQFTNNRLTTNPWTGAAMTYDAAGNLTNDGYQTYTYDATGQQATASAGVLTQSYDGDGLRVKKTESGVTTYYLRSTILGGQVVNEIDQSGGLGRGYVYLGGQMLALQNGGSVNWVHQDPVTKSQRITNSSGAVTSTIDLDPWGGETARSSNQAFQPHRYTTYERDANGGDEAMMRRYTAKWHRFDQPDPYDGSYSLGDPQSFNRYAYTQNDPVNFVDPTGLITYDGAADPHLIAQGLVGGLVWAIQHGGVFAFNQGIRLGEEILPYWFFNFSPQEHGPGQPQPCPPTASELEADPVVQAALNQSFNNSQFGSTNAHEEGGWIFMNAYNRNTFTVRWAAGGPISINPGSIPIMPGARLVGEFHTHPGKQGHPVPGMPHTVYGNPKTPSTADINGANTQTHVPGLIMYRNKKARRISRYGPDRGQCTNP